MVAIGAVMGLVVGAGGWLAFAIAAVALILWRHALASQSEDVARACHELRGPLAAARLGVELSVTRPTASAARMRAIELELDRAALALDDLQGVDRTGEHELVEVAAWLRDSVEAWTPVATRRGVTLSLRWEGPAAWVRGQRPRLAQATGNLIANAIEHGEGSVEVNGRVADGRVHVEVVDEGAGLPPELTRWLEREARGRVRRGRPAGRGRGLLIVRAVAAAHGGRLTAEASARGPRFVLKLPLADAPSAG